MSCGIYADEFTTYKYATSDINKSIKELKAQLKYKLGICSDKLKSEPTLFNLMDIEKIVFNDPVVTLIDRYGDKIRIRTQGKEKFDMMFGYYLVLCKYLSNNDTYSELLAHIYDERSVNKRIDIMEAFFLGKLGVKLCRKIDVYEVLREIDFSNNPKNKKKNYTINFQEVLNA